MDPRLTILCPILKKMHSIFIIVLVGKVQNIIGNTIESFGIKDVSPFVSKVLQDLTNILLKQSTTIHGRTEDGRVMFHDSYHIHQ